MARWMGCSTVLRVAVAAIVIGGLAGGLPDVGRAEDGTTYNDALATQRYMNAYVMYAAEERQSRRHLELAVERFADAITMHCQKILQGAVATDSSSAVGRQEINQVEEEIDGALEVVEARATERQTLRFGRSVTGLQWSDGELTRMMMIIARTAKAVVRLPAVPRVCADMKIWVSSGFRRLAPATGRFIRDLETVVEVASRGTSGDIESAVQRRLAKYESHKERAELDRANRSLRVSQEWELSVWRNARYKLFRDLGLRTPRLR